MRICPAPCRHTSTLSEYDSPAGSPRPIRSPASPVAPRRVIGLGATRDQDRRWPATPCMLLTCDLHGSPCDAIAPPRRAVAPLRAPRHWALPAPLPPPLSPDLPHARPIYPIPSPPFPDLASRSRPRGTAARRPCRRRQRRAAPWRRGAAPGAEAPRRSCGHRRPESVVQQAVNPTDRTHTRTGWKLCYVLILSNGEYLASGSAAAAVDLPTRC